MADMGALNNTRPGSRSRGGVLGPAGLNPEVAHRDELEQARVALIERQRAYADGTQYDRFNKERLDSLCRDQKVDTLPEHERVHAYATQIGESVGFLVSRLGAGFSITAQSPDVQSVIDDVVAGCDVLASVDEDGVTQASTDTPLHDAIVAGDVPVLIDWDDVEGRVTLELWESEAVEFVDDQRGGIEEVVLTYTVWKPDVTGTPVETLRRRRYTLQVNPSGVAEARVDVYDSTVGTPFDVTRDTPDSQVWLGVGVIPWALLRADRRGLRQLRGSSLVTKQVMETADRYNSVEQTGFIIARYNSHSNIAASGDEVMARQMSGKDIIRKDVADVLTFPENTDVEVLSLPTDPAMIEHQRGVLTDALYSAFGLVRLDPSALSGLGQVSGYALEIMNGRTDATFGRVARCWRKDWAGLISLILDVTAWRGEGRWVWVDDSGDYIEAPALNGEYDDVEDVPDATAPDGYRPMWHWWDIDPDAVFPDREVAIKLGSGAVVDDVKARDDFTAGLISRNEALRTRGKTPDQIAMINDEIDAQDAAAGAGTEAGAAGDYSAPAPGTLGGTLGNATRTDN